ncbi:tRNA lysidine(34) synthetase TilS [Geitlerinema sp. PCC 9228]|jgi:tRNA(Ile)-lysidine synthase|uniref:tRNA lysidine(34) synthetase TilS n=1 Tax=Geitlerinema sp. PCC 9228 TaxID=111611 RepID=UPI0008F9C0DF|nr:tRNA lysidine(34) synthetase TilS [Geitlerinema sp. PCC 9228]
MPNQDSWTLLHAQIHQTLREKQLLPRRQSVLIAVSGGQDSLCLAKLLWDLQPKWEWQLGIAHCDHRWHTDAGMAEHVEAIANQWQLPFYIKVAPTGGSHTINLQSEAAARKWRYQALTEMAIEVGYGYLVVAHTLSDRAETLLYNLMRGAGADGLQALTWQRFLQPNLQLVRPLLEISRQQTGDFCRQMGLPVWEDPQNENWQYARPRIRHQLLPYLQTHFNPKVEQSLAQTAELLRADVAYLETAARDLRQRALYQHNTFDRQILQKAPLALQRRALRQFLQDMLPHTPRFEHVEKLVALINAPNRSRTDPFPGGAIAEVSGNWILWQEAQ